MKRVLVIWVALALLLGGCARKKRVRLPPAPSPTPAAPQVGQTEEGLASWYGHPYHGRPAADGEIYDMETMVAAHRTLPFNTWVQVLDLDNDKTVTVRIIDRGPFVDGRIIDLSHAAARALDMIGPGTARVRVRIIEAPAAPEAARFAVQVGAFRQKANADRLRSAMENRYGKATLVLRDGNPKVWRVLVGNQPSEDSAGALAERIREDGAERGNAFVVRLDN